MRRLCLTVTVWTMISLLRVPLCSGWGAGVSLAVLGSDERIYVLYCRYSDRWALLLRLTITRLFGGCVVVILGVMRLRTEYY